MSIECWFVDYMSTFGIYIDISHNILHEVSILLKKERAYSSFKDALFDGALMPGQFVTQQELCDLLNMSVTPMRDALKELESEGLITVMPQKGLQITLITKMYIKDAFQMRRFLELGAVRFVAEMDDRSFLNDILDDMQAIMARAEVLIDRDLLIEAHRLDDRMHFHLISALDNALVSEMHMRVTDRIRMIRLNGMYSEPRLIPILKEHTNVLTACLTGDQESAVKALEYHLSVSEQRALGGEYLGI